MRKMKGVLGEAAAQAEADIALYGSNRRALATLPLGRFSETGVRSLLLRRLFLKLALPLERLLAFIPASAKRHLEGKRARLRVGLLAPRPATPPAHSMGGPHARPRHAHVPRYRSARGASEPLRRV